MHELSIAAVAHVCQAEAARLRELVGELENAPPRRLEGILRALSKTGDTLSAALVRVSSYVDRLEGEDSDNRTAPPDDTGLFEVVRRLRVASRFGHCEVCGGINDHGGGHGRIENRAVPDEVQFDPRKVRARQLAYEARR